MSEAKQTEVLELPCYVVGKKKGNEPLDVHYPYPGVVTREMDQAFACVKRICTGTVNINTISGSRVESSPFGGVKDSGLDVKEKVTEAIKYMTNVKTFSLPW